MGEHNDDSSGPKLVAPLADFEDDTLPTPLGPDDCKAYTQTVLLGESAGATPAITWRDTEDAFANNRGPRRLGKKCDPEKEKKLKYTTFIILVNVALGGLYSLSPTTFLDILDQTDMGIEPGALLFIMTSLGYTLGSLVSGILYDIFDHDVIFGGSAVLAGIFIIFVPLSTLFPLVVSFLFVSNIFQGSLDSGSTMLCAKIWRKNANPYQQALSFFYAMGGIVTPFVAEPFLRTERTEGNVTSNNTASLHLLSNVSALTEETERIRYFQSDLYVPFLILGIFTIFTSTPFPAIYIRAYCKNGNRNEINDGEETDEDMNRTHRYSRKPLIRITLMIGIFFMAYGFCYSGVRKFSMTFVVSYLGWSKLEGTWINSLSWSALAGGCFVGMLLAKYVRPSHMVLTTLLLTTVGSVSLLAGSYTSKALVWISFVLIFAGSGSLYPSAISWIDQSLVHVNGKMCSLFIVASSLGDVANSWLLGYLFENSSPLWFIYLALGSCVFQFLVLGAMLATKFRKGLFRNLSNVTLAVDPPPTPLPPPTPH